MALECESVEEILFDVPELHSNDDFDFILMIHNFYLTFEDNGL